MNKFLLLLAGAWWTILAIHLLSGGYTVREDIKIATVLLTIAYMGYMTIDLLKKKN